jgi:hypothetical protein
MAWRASHAVPMLYLEFVSLLTLSSPAACWVYVESMHAIRQTLSFLQAYRSREGYVRTKDSYFAYKPAPIHLITSPSTHYYNIIIVYLILKRYTFTSNLSPNPCDIISEPRVRVLWCRKESQNFNELNVCFNLEDKIQLYLEDGWMRLENSPSMKYNLNGNVENCDFQLRLQDP